MFYALFYSYSYTHLLSLLPLSIPHHEISHFVPSLRLYQNIMSNVTPESLIPETALRRMAPAPGGNWVVVAQFDDHFTLAYIMDGGQESVTYDFYPCDTEEKIMNICGDAIHEYNKR